ncbi:MAG: sugar phosphate nucleotidyltransferase [Gemmobacter sp.]|nr:sugar phosphate nucleotidyltransferase [Gemmobacter sp.]
MHTHSLDLTHTAAVLLAHSQGSRLHELTARDCNSALHFAGVHRLADFAMASVVRAGIDRVVVATQHYPATLQRHLDSVWHPTLPDGGLVFRNGPDVAGADGYVGALDTIRANAAGFDGTGVQEIVVVPADQVHAIDLSSMIAEHRRSGLPITVAAMPMPLDDAQTLGGVRLDAEGQVVGYHDPGRAPYPLTEDGARAMACLGVYVLDWSWLKERLRLQALSNFAPDLLALAAASREAGVWIMGSDAEAPYWRKVDSLDAYRRASLDFEARPLPCQRPVAAGAALRLPPAVPGRDRFSGQVQMGDVRLLSPVLNSDDRERWCVLDRSVLMPGARVDPGVRLSRTIVAPGTAVPHGIITGEDPQEDGRWFRVSSEGTILITTAMLAHRGATRTRLFPLFGRSGARPVPST